MLSNGTGTTGHPHAEEEEKGEEFRHWPCTFHKYSKWIIDLNVKCKTTKLLEDNIGEHLGDLGLVIRF